MRFLCMFSALALSFCLVNATSKYSREANVKPDKIDVNFRTLDKPFRMAKLNMVWSKAQQRLPEPKLKSLYSDLMIQDKEEITFKKYKSEGGDKEGLREAELRRKLFNVMRAYGLDEHFDSVQNSKKVKDHMNFNDHDDQMNKSLFKDKKLAMLWGKAEAAGFTSEELAALREEFHHHQEKIDQYYMLLDQVEQKEDGDENAVNSDERDKFNELASHLETNEVHEIKKDYLHKANLVRDKHKDLKDNYDRLNRIAARGPLNKEFVEPKVQELWRLATRANFTKDELQSLKGELQHYEARLLKLRHLHADQVSKQHHLDAKIAATGDKLDHMDSVQQLIKKHSRKVEKLHLDIENRIMERHSEL